MSKFLFVVTGFVLLVALVATGVAASNVEVVDPVKANIPSTDGSKIDLGIVGPGQTVQVQFGRDTGVIPSDIVTTKTAVWDKASIVTSTLPDGWTSKDSLLYETPLTTFITASPNATDGVYTFSIKLTDELEGTPAQTVGFKIRVTKDVLGVDVSPEKGIAGIGQPAIYAVELTSKSSASDVFEISATGLPYQWKSTKVVLVPHSSKKVVYYEVVGNVQKEVPFKLQVKSLSSPVVQVEKALTVETSTSLLQDMKATSLGLPLFPSVEQHIYSLLGLVANVVSK